MAKKAKPANRFTGPVGTASYPCLFEARANNEKDDKKFSLTVIYDTKEEIEGLVNAAIEAAKERAAERIWGGSIPAKLEIHGLKDGNGNTDANDVQKEEFADKWYIQATTKEDSPPYVVDSETSPITDRKAIYGGCKVRPVVSAAGWVYGNKKGVSLYLNGVMKTADGEAFGNVVSIEDDFAE